MNDIIQSRLIHHFGISIRLSYEKEKERVRDIPMFCCLEISDFFHSSASQQEIGEELEQLYSQHDNCHHYQYPQMDNVSSYLLLPHISGPAQRSVGKLLHFQLLYFPLLRILQSSTFITRVLSQGLNWAD